MKVDSYQGKLTQQRMYLHFDTFLVYIADIIKRLQKVQNSCVRFLFGNQTVKKWESVTPYLSFGVTNRH